jgi:hypothetical protein
LLVGDDHLQHWFANHIPVEVLLECGMDIGKEFTYCIWDQNTNKLHKVSAPISGGEPLFTHTDAKRNLSKEPSKVLESQEKEKKRKSHARSCRRAFSIQKFCFVFRETNKDSNKLKARLSF